MARLRLSGPCWLDEAQAHKLVRQPKQTKMKHGRIDANQVEVIHALRKVGAKVQSLADIGQGCADILAYFRGTLYLLECKDGRKAPSERRLTPAQVAWHREWPVHVVTSVEEALAVIGAVS